MATLFISDLHLEAGRPEIGAQFLAFLAGPARDADALYILGDLFEAWVGDDDPNPYYAEMKTALRELVDNGVPVFFMHGNRDFLIGDGFAADTGVTLLEDPHPIELHGEKVLPILPRVARLIDETKKRLVNERGRVEGHVSR